MVSRIGRPLFLIGSDQKLKLINDNTMIVTRKGYKMQLTTGGRFIIM